jgi:putative phosphoesterase
MTIRALVVSDTHIRRGGSRTLPGAVLSAAERADVVLHAGDIMTASVLEALSELAPVHAVLGNNDLELIGRLPESTQLVLDGVTVAMVHDSGPAEGRPRRLKRWFPDAGVVVFGHSHLPYNGPGLDGQWLLNPGSATERRRAPTHTMAWLTLRDGQVAGAELVDIDHAG